MKTDNIIKAGVIAREAVSYARGIVKKDMLLIELAEAIESKIKTLGGKPAFPVNLSINEIAAHAAPSYNDEERAHGLLKIDIGVHVNGSIADTAFSVDLDNSKQNEKLIKAAQEGLNAAVKIAKKGTTLGAIGKAISETIIAHGCVPIANLSGHGIDEYDVHAGITIPNYNNGDTHKLEDGVYAIEPFTTFGAGKVQDGKPSGIYQLIKEGNVRDQTAREVLAFIVAEYQKLPFCSRWIHKKFGTRGLVGLKFIERAGLLHHYAQLIETSRGIVAQAEHTILIHNNDVKVTT